MLVARSQLEHIRDRSIPICFMRFCIHFSSSLLVSLPFVISILIACSSVRWSCNFSFFYIVIAQRVTLDCRFIGRWTMHNFSVDWEDDAHWNFVFRRPETNQLEQESSAINQQNYCIIHDRMEIVSDNVWQRIWSPRLQRNQEQNSSEQMKKKREKLSKIFSKFSVYIIKHVSRWLMTHSVGTHSTLTELRSSLF